MLLTISNTRPDARDLGWLLHKNPAKWQTFEQNFGKAHVFYPEVAAERCTAALWLELDPVGLVRNRRGPAGENFALEQYVNDRPYVASSFLSVALSSVFRSAMAGQCKDRPELPGQALPLTARLPVVPCRGDEDVLRRIFEPLGYRVTLTRHTLDAKFPEWGESPYYAVELAANITLQNLLTHLYVLIPVLDNDKHYWVGDDEVAKLLKHGAGWLGAHPERELIARRYLRHRHSLARMALERLVGEEQPEDSAQARAAEEEQVEKPLSLNAQRLGTVVAALKASGAKKVLDLGCGEGNLLRELLKEKQFERIVGMDVSIFALERAADKLRLERLAPKQRERIELLQGSLMYRDKRLNGFDAAAVVEVIEHFDSPRLAAFERVLFEFAKPGTVVLTTPNVEYNVKFETLPAGKFRHRDHRFEWTRAQFQEWGKRVAERFGYAVNFAGIGPEDAEAGTPTQMGIFRAK